MRRIYLVFGFIVLWYFLIISRLFYWQIISGENLREQASAQYFTELKLPASRGQILTADGSPLALNKLGFFIYADTKNIKNSALSAREIAQLLSLDQKYLETEFNNPKRAWLALSHKVDAVLADKLRELKIVGLGFEKEPKRYYPEASLSAQMLGFIAADQNGDDRGYFGLEGYYDRELRGKDGVMRIEKDAAGVPILVGEAKRLSAQDGSTLVTSIDRAAQRIVEKRLKEGLAKYGAREGTITLMEPATGRILAMASFPNYDPTNIELFDKSVYKNPVVGSSFEPGSTFKTLVMAAALEEKVIKPTTIIDESGSITIGEYTVKTWNDKYHGKINMADILAYSSNVGMVEIGRKLGKEKLLKYINDFGFGKLTGIDLEDETSAEIRPEKSWYEIDLAAASFGQGIAVTPLQMVRAVAALANDGWLMEPQIVSEIKDSRGQIIKIKPKKIKQVISSATAKTITELMIAAVERGDAKWAKPVGYRIAGKTGTAQIPVAGHYDEKKTIASFVGFAPADKPRYVMLVTLTEPTSSPWGSETAAPLFFTISRDLFAYWGISPE